MLKERVMLMSHASLIQIMRKPQILTGDAKMEQQVSIGE